MYVGVSVCVCWRKDVVIILVVLIVILIQKQECTSDTQANCRTAGQTITDNYPHVTKSHFHVMSFFKPSLSSLLYSVLGMHFLYFTIIVSLSFVDCMDLTKYI